mgnify:CR=1 FL=1
MNRKLMAKILIDICLTVSLLLLMPYSLIGETAHEWIGMAMLVLFIVHHILNRKWIGKRQIYYFQNISDITCDSYADTNAGVNDKRNTSV